MADPASIGIQVDREPLTRAAERVTCEQATLARQTAVIYPQGRQAVQQGLTVQVVVRTPVKPNTLHRCKRKSEP